MIDIELDSLIDRRIRGAREDRPGQAAANEIAEMYAASARRFEARRRLQLNADRFRWHSHLARHFGLLAEEHAARAEELLEDERGSGA